MSAGAGEEARDKYVYMHTHTHTHRVHSYRTQIKLWQWASEHRLSRQSGEPPTAEQSHKKKKKRQDWQVELEKNQNVHGAQPVWIIFVTSSMINLLLFHFPPFPLPSPPFSSSSRISTTPSCHTCLRLIIRLAFFLSHAAFHVFPLVFRLVSVCEVWWKPTGTWRRRI